MILMSPKFVRSSVEKKCIAKLLPTWGEHDDSVHLLTGRQLPNRTSLGSIQGDHAPSLACRFRGLLAADNGAQEVESLAEECSEDIKQVQSIRP